ncbi:MAG: BatD family protein [Bacteroidales bacterium]
MRKKLLALKSLMILLPAVLSGQDIQLSAEYPGVVSEGEQFTISWTINSEGRDFTAPAFTGFYKLMGPQTSYSSSTQLINGRYSQQTSYSYVYYLQAMKPGIYVLGPASIKVKNKEFKSDSIRIEVISTGQAAQGTNPPGGAGNTEAMDNQPASDIYLRLTLGKDEVFVGEPVPASVKLYTRTDISSLNDLKYPSFNSFLKEDIKTPPLNSLRRENVNGMIYGTGIIQQLVLFPQVAGDLTIDKIEVTALVQKRSGQTDPFFGDFFATYTNVPKAVVSQPVRLKVKPLPGNRPADFSGIVGKIEMSANLNHDTVNVNDALNFRITVTGSGYLKLASPPEIKFPADVEVYDPKVSDNINYSASGVSGQKVFEYVLIPRHNGEYSIPPVTYTFFNPSSRQYETLTSKEFKFYVRKGGETEQQPVFSGVAREDVKYLGKDIRFIRKTSGSLFKAGNYLISQRSFLVIYGFSLLVFLGVLFVRREHVRRNSDISLVRNRKAAKVAIKRLREADKCLKSGTVDRFHEEILKGLWGYLSDKLSIPLGELTRVNAAEALGKKGVGEDLINDLTGILDQCEYARFAPSTGSGGASEIYSKASGIISSLENLIS